MFGWIHRYRGTTETEEHGIGRADYKLYADFQLGRQLVSPTHHVIQEPTVFVWSIYCWLIIFPSTLTNKRYIDTKIVVDR